MGATAAGGDLRHFFDLIVLLAWRNNEEAPVKGALQRMGATAQSVRATASLGIGR